MVEKRGQAAMEFLMTYGWAILAAIIAIAVLAYFGVFSPSRYMPDVCSVTAPLGCDEHQINSTAIGLIIRNGAGESITPSNVSLAGCGEVTLGTAIADGGTRYYTFICAHSAGAKFKGDIVITYTKTGSTIAQKATGSVSGKVSA